LLAAILVVAGVIGVGGMFPKIIDPEWVRGSPPRSATSTGHVSVSAPGKAPPPELSQSVVALEPVAETARSPGPALTLDAEAKANALPADPVGAAAAKTGRPTERAKVARGKKKIVSVEHHRRRYPSDGRYGAGWGGWSSSSSSL
jgi:hypothetical protein